jgi:Leucine-rich repeat (LRR) protein
MKKILLLILAAITIGVTGCDKKLEDDLLNPELSLTPAMVDANAAAGTYNIAVKSNTAWVAAVDNASVNSWCRIESGAKGTENGTITVALEANTVIAVRTATLSVSAGTLSQQVTVTQAAAAPALSLDKESIPATATAGTYAIAVTSNSTWTAESNADWCTLAGDSGNGNGTVTVNVTENSTVSTRAATVTVSSGTLTQQVAVTQAAAGAALSLDKASIPATAEAGTYTIAVTSNSTWTAESNADWCTLADDSGNGNGTVTVNVTENSTVSTRTATITVSSGTLTEQVAVTQAAASLTLSLDKSSIPAIAEAGTYTIAVTSNSTWTAESNAGWCTLADASGNGNGTVTVNITENTTTSSRAATVTVSSGTLSRPVAVLQAGLNVSDNSRASDSLALVALYNATGGPNWTLQGNWHTAAPLEQWSGVTVRNNRVVGLQKSSTGFSGSLPAELGNLTMLESLYIGSMPNLGGTLPASIGNLTMLETLHLLQMPNLAGTLPASIGNLTNLKELAIQGTGIGGSIPQEIGNLVNLETLYVLFNNFSGVLPDAIGNLSNLRTLSFSEENVSGTLPSSLGNLQNLDYLAMNAKLTGTIPETFKNLTNLSTLHLRNELSGTIPAWIGEFPSLSWLILEGNQFSGSVPDGLYNPAKPINIYLGYNNLSGTLPPNILAGINAGRINVCPQNEGYGFSNYDCNDLVLSMADVVGEWTVTEDEYYSNAWHSGTYTIDIANVSGNEILITGITGNDETKISATVTLGYDNYLFISAQDIVPTRNPSYITRFAPLSYLSNVADNIGLSFPSLKINKVSGGLEIEVYGLTQPYSYIIIALNPETRNYAGFFMYAKNTVWRKAGAAQASAKRQKQSKTTPERSLSPLLPQ